LIKVAFYKGTRPGLQGVFNRSVRWWTNGPYSHCEAVLFTKKDGYSVCASSSKMDGGVRVKLIKLNPNHWDLIEVDVEPDIAAKWFYDRLGKAYDTLGLFGFVWRRADGHKDKYVCSEAVSASLGFKESWRLDPNTFAAVLSSFLKIKGEL
jgi:hypothetical protein